MQALDSFISPIPSFEGDILISIVPVLARPPGGESNSDPTAGASANASKTWVGKQKQLPTRLLRKKAKKATGKSSGGIQINKHVPKALALTPPLGPRKGIPIHQSRRYTYLEYFLL
jgi:hypothetical protein